MIAKRRGLSLSPLTPSSSGASTAPSPPATSSTLSTHWSWSSHCSNKPFTITENTSPIDEHEHERINKARQRLILREDELQRIINFCNSKMDIVRRKLCND